MGRGKGPTGRTAKFERRPRATLRMGEPKVDASSSDGSHASDTADRGTEQLGVIFPKAPEPARGRSKRETASATVPAGLRKGEVVLALPVTNVRARHAQHTGLGYVHADGEGAPPSTWLLVVGQFPSSVARAGCRRLALRLLRMSDAHLSTGTGAPLASSVQALHNTATDLNAPEGDKVCNCTFWVAPLGTRVGRSREDWTGTRGGGRCR